MNEPLCRALAAAGLADEDVATRLGVDTKTVRRWVEGRVPYRRHRWALAGLLHVDDADLWPQLRVAGVRPRDVRAVYPHRDDVPDALWLRLIRSAQQEIGLLDRNGAFLAEVLGGLETLGERAGAGVPVWICLRDPAAPPDPSGAGLVDGDRGGAGPSVFWPLRGTGDVQIRVYSSYPYAGIFVADDEMLIVHYAFGIPPGRSPVTHLERCDGAEVFAMYLESFKQVWQAARPYAGGVGQG